MSKEKRDFEGNEAEADLTAGSTNISISPTRDVDVAARFLLALDPSIRDTPIDPKEARKVLWKIDLILLPLLWITTIIGAVDKVVISNAAIYGMKTDCHLVGNQYSWVGSIFYFGYLLFEYPSSFLIQRLPVAKFFSATVLVWSVLMMCTAAANDFGGLATVRFIMGMAEAVIFPVCSITTVMWWKTREQPLRAACYLSQFSSIFSGVVSYGIGHAHTSIAAWRLLFLVLGGFSVLWSIVLYLWLPDSPTTCRWLDDRQKLICLQRVKDNNTGIEDKEIKWYQIRECVVDPKTWLLFIFAIAQNIPNGGLITFSSIIVSGLGYSKLITTVLGIPTGVVATVWSWMMAYPAGRIKNSRGIIIAACNVVTIVCAILMWKLPRSNKHGLLAAYYVFYTYWGPYVISLSLVTANTSGHTKKVTMNAIFFIGYCIGNIIGPQVFQSTDAPAYSHGYEGLLACLVVAMAAILGYSALCYVENKRRDREGSTTFMDSTMEAFSDLTDGEKKDFRYSF
ncbi:putative allantoate permease [Saccharata proteae CBS 121410]|uniref:Allantoate permease n=1 Tax=Saccharata proteae CBS 121410 TaxID=1314787 RepID=A0A9P4LVX5_9PEZI|nr:putative allantoate permease [Saccharata proteae CBS 121410]